MSKAQKRNALGMFILAAGFCLFFQASKHDPGLSRVNPFAEDPYDAVGSAAVQFVLFIALLSLIRAFRPYPPDVPLIAQERLLARGQLMGIAAVMVTLAADAVAVARHPSMWLGSFSGYELLALIGGLFLWAVLTGWLLLRSMEVSFLPAVHSRWFETIAIPIAAFLIILALYPEGMRQSFFGAIFTALAGSILFFIPVWALGTAVVPGGEEASLDLMSDLAAVYGGLRSRVGFLRPLCVFTGRMRSLRVVLGWFNPRRHRWNLPLLTGALIGLFFFFEEAIQGGGQLRLSKLLVVAAVYVGVESTSVLLGYKLLAKPLGLFQPLVRCERDGAPSRTPA